MKNSLPFGRSIKTKLLMALIGTNLVALLVMALLTYSDSYTTVKDNFIVSSSQTLTQANGRIDQYLASIEMQAKTLAKLDIIDEIISIDGSETQAFEQIMSNTLKAITESTASMLNVYFVEHDTQKMYIYPEADVSGITWSDKDWYQNALNNVGSAIWSDPYTDSITGTNILTVSTTVLDTNNKVIGVVGVDVNLSIVSQVLSSMVVGDHGYVYIVDKNGIGVAHPDASIINSDTITKLSLWETVKNNASGFAEYTYNGVQKYSTYMTNSRTNWKIIAALETSEVSTDTNNILVTSMMILAIVLVVVIFLSLVISNALIKNIRILQNVMVKAATGDLSVSASISSNDEIKLLGESFNTMLLNIKGLISNVKTSSSTVYDTSCTMASMSNETSSAINEIAITISEVAIGTNEQSRDIERNSINIGELAHKLEDITDATTEVRELTRTTKEKSESGLAQIKQLVDSSKVSANIAANVNNIMVEVNESSKEINYITDTINNIAEQTNLLALNAAIEAARAGESGRGFAVVAEEIRKLAEQSSKATSDIGSLINTMNSRTEEAVKAMDGTKTVFEAQNSAVLETNSIFQTILGSVDELSNKINRISKSIHEIDQQKNEIVESTANLSAISQEMSASTEEVSASTEQVSASTEVASQHAKDLSHIANQLIEQINQFKY